MSQRPAGTLYPAQPLLFERGSDALKCVQRWGCGEGGTGYGVFEEMVAKTGYVHPGEDQTWEGAVEGPWVLGPRRAQPGPVGGKGRMTNFSSA